MKYWNQLKKNIISFFIDHNQASVLSKNFVLKQVSVEISRIIQML